MELVGRNVRPNVQVAFDRTVDRGMQFFESLKAVGLKHAGDAWGQVELEKEGGKTIPGDKAGL